MKENERLLLDLVKRALFGEASAFPETVSFEELYKEAKAQVLLPLVFAAFSEKELSLMPEKIREEWENDVIRYSVSNSRLLSEQKKIEELLSENKIPFAILKGSSVSRYYPDSSLRVMGDIDILVPSGEETKATELLQKSLGFGEVLDDSHHCHKTVLKGKIAAEIHYEPNGLFLIEDQKIKEEIKKYFAAWDKVQNNFLDAEHQAVLLLLHKLEHFIGSGLGLRQLCDWAMFLNEEMTAELWNNLEIRLKAFGMLKFTKAITKVCTDYLGLDRKKVPWCEDDTMSEQIIERIFISGNFGQKEDDYGQQFFSGASSKNRIASFFKVYRATAERVWSPCKNHPILLVFSPFVVIFKYLKLKGEGKKPSVNLIDSYKKAGPKQKLYHEIAPFVAEYEEEKQ